MATDPVRRVRKRSYDTPFTTDLETPLTKLAKLPASLDVPYLTVTADWSPDEGHPGRRSAQTQIERAIAALVAEAGPRGAVFDSLQSDAARIAELLQTGVDPAAHGLFIVANAARGIFEFLALGFSIPTGVLTAPTPQLTALAKVGEDHPTYAVLVADQQNASLGFITQSSREQGVYLESSIYPRKQAQGGISKSNFQRRADERVAAFARVVASETKQALAEAGVDTWVLAGDEAFSTALLGEIDRELDEMLVSQIRVENTISPHEVITRTLPLVIEAERLREAAAVDQLRETLGGGYAVAGAIDVLNALQARQVGQLLMTDGYQERGWADYSVPLFGLGEVPAEHPIGGDPANLIGIDLDEEFVRLAAISGAEIEIVHAETPVAPDEGTRLPAGAPLPKSEPAQLLDEVGGVGAILRYAAG